MPARAVRSLAVPLRGAAALLHLIRAHSAAGAALAVWIGGRLAGAEWAPGWLLPMAVAFLLSAAGNAFNDAHDAEIDQINRPRRPIPRGAVTPRGARWISYGCVLAALLLAAPFGPISLLGTLGGSALIFLYTTHLKGIPLLGNVTVGVLTGMAMGYGGMLGGDIPAVTAPAVALGLLFGGREVLKTIHDQPGDRSHGVRTVATVGGERPALLITTLCFALALALLAWWASQHGGMWPVAVMMTVVCGILLTALWRGEGKRSVVAGALQWSKAAGLLLLAALSVL